MPQQHTPLPAESRVWTPATQPPPDPGPVPLWGLAGGGFALLAIAIEVASSLFANSRVPAWLVAIAPLGWPPAGRVVWWLAVAGGVATFHLASARAGHAPSWWIRVGTVAPFVAFAVGIVVGAEWAAWH